VKNDDESDRLSELTRQREWAQKSLDSATVAYKRVRQMRGANAHQRSWHFKEQMEKAQTRLTEIDNEISKLRDGIASDS
jgi:hypothetical protein